MRNVVVPDQGEDFTADPSELYFDLAFVFGLSQLVGLLINEHDWTGIGKAAILFVLIWLVWSQFTWSANAVPGNQRIVRAFFMVATAITVPMSASVSTAFADGGPVFAVALALIFLSALALYLLSVRDQPNVFRSVVIYASVAALALVPLVVGSFLDGAARTVAWLLSFVVFLVAMYVSTSGEFILRAGHFAERHGLIMIVALGEVIVAVGIPVVKALEDADKGIQASTVIVLLASGAFAGLFWWLYFDRLQPALEHLTEQLTEPDRSSFARDVYSAGHVPVVAGVILSAAAVEEIALHPGDEVPTSFGLMLFGGVALFLGGVSIVAVRAFRGIAYERIIGAIAVGAVIAFGAGLQGLWVLILVDVVLLAVILFEYQRFEPAPEPA